jgi:thiamine biosynthesis lipoprotein
MAVSGGYGTPFEPTGHYHHIFEPVSGDSARTLLDVAVVAPRATIADGLATAICVTGEARAAKLLKAFPGSCAIVTRTDGTRATIGPGGPIAT